MSLSQCIDHIYQDVPTEKQIPKTLIIAQAALETGWGVSRFANEGNNLFGIRTFNKDDEWLLPITWDQNKWIGWGVKVYETKCDSVRDYVRIINEVWAYEELRKVRDNGGNVYEMADHLTLYASKPTYTKLIKQLIKYNIEGVYDL
jgi:Bax protein